MLGALALCMGSLAHGEGQVENVFSSSIAGRTEVVIEGKELGRPRVTRMLGGKLVAVEFRAGLLGKGRTLNVNAKGLKSVRVAWRSAKPKIVRVDLRVEKNTPLPALTQDPRGWRLAFGTTTLTQQTPAKPQAPKTAVQVAEEVPLVPGLVAGRRAPLDKLPLDKFPTKGTYTVAKNDSQPKLVSSVPAAPPLPKPEDVRVTLDFVNTDIVQIMKALALQAGVNVVTAPEVKGNLTVSLHDVSVEDALKLVTSLAAIDYRRVNDTYIVATNDRMDAVRRQITGEAAPVEEARVSEAYMVRGGKAVDLVTAVAGKEKTNVGNVSLIATPPLSASNQAIVLHGPAAEVTRIKAIFEQIDKQGAEGETYEVYEVRHVNPSALREDLLVAVPGLRATVAPAAAVNPQVYTSTKRITDASLVAGDLQRVGTGTENSQGAGSGGAGTVSTNASENAKAREDVRDIRNARGLMQPFSNFEPVGEPMRLVLRGTPEQIRQAKEYASKVDVAPKQIALELRVMELNQEDALKLGIDWSILRSSGTVRRLRVNQGSDATELTPGTVGAAFSGGLSLLAQLDSIANKQNIIARPNLLAIDGRESELFVGDVVRYIKSIQATQNGVTVLVDEERVGVRLAVFPRIGADGAISLDMRPILSYLRGFTAVPGGGQIPQTSERMTQATTVIKSGETVALGGLILDQDRKDVRGIPVLKDLPIIGQLFRRTDNSKQRTEVVFFLTAKEVTQEDRADAARPKG
jgi:general secretion pathway protein D